jgi:hypothetical protein
MEGNYRREAVQRSADPTQPNPTQTFTRVGMDPVYPCRWLLLVNSGVACLTEGPTSKRSRRCVGRPDVYVGAVLESTSIVPIESFARLRIYARPGCRDHPIVASSSIKRPAPLSEYSRLCIEPCWIEDHS